MKTAREHTNEFVDKNLKWSGLTSDVMKELRKDILEYTQSIFDSCIEVARDEADREVVENRYKTNESSRKAQRMAESISKQLISLRGEYCE